MFDGTATLDDAAGGSRGSAAASIELPAAALRWRRWAAVALSLAMAAMLVRQISALGWQQLWAVLPTDPLFYVLLTAMYLTLPISELIIFRRQWAIGLSNIWLFLRKGVLNAAVLGYSGEAYLLLWAKRQPGLRASAIGVVKDVSITSAMAATLVTLAALAGLLLFQDRLVSAGLFSATDIGRLGWGALLLCVPALIIMAFSKRLLTLPRRENLTIFGMHMLRLCLTIALLLAAWHVALPAVAWPVWIVLAALRLVVSRVPFAPNTDLLFSTIGIGLAGSSYSHVAALLALCAALTLVGHGLVVMADWSVRIWRLRTRRGVQTA